MLRVPHLLRGWFADAVPLSRVCYFIVNKIYLEIFCGCLLLYFVEHFDEIGTYFGQGNGCDSFNEQHNAAAALAL